MMWKHGLQIAYLAVGFLTVLEFIFIRGMFTWLPMVLAVAVLGAANVIVSCRNREWLPACHYILSAVALCMGYLVLA
jgi:hypothetical protein